jgi:hypothetical protein
MGIIRRPLTGNRYWKEVSFYRAYADLARINLNEDRYFESIVLCCIGLDVLLNTIAERLIEADSHSLDPRQRRLLQGLRSNQATGGLILKQFQMAYVLDQRFLKALSQLNNQRNRVIHPIEKGKVKGNAITPPVVSKPVADRFYRLFCHVIDLAGGRSPRSEEKDLNQYVEWRRSVRRKHFPKK